PLRAPRPAGVGDPRRVPLDAERADPDRAAARRARVLFQRCARRPVRAQGVRRELPHRGRGSRRVSRRGRRARRAIRQGDATGGVSYMTGHKTLELMGSGEFEPWSEEVDRFSLSRADFGDGSVVILPTASAPEGDEVFNRWAGMGLDHYKAMGVHARVVDLRTREDAFLDVLIEELANPSMIF